MSTLFAAPIARFDYRVRIAAALLRSAPRSEHMVVAGMTLTSTAAAWPLRGAWYPLVAVPALLALAALIRHHLDGLGARRDALTAAGANAADALVIQIAGPLAATGAGGLAGISAAVVLGRPPVPALAPLAMGVVATLLIRRRWLGAPALAAGALAGLVTAVAVRLSVHAAVPLARPRSRPIGGLSGTHSAATTTASAVASASAWSTLWPVALAAVLVLAATQAAIVHRDVLKQLARRLTARSRA